MQSNSTLIALDNFTTTDGPCYRPDPETPTPEPSTSTQPPPEDFVCGDKLVQPYKLCDGFDDCDQGEDESGNICRACVCHVIVF